MLYYINLKKIQPNRKEKKMNKNFVPINITPSTREDLRFICKAKDTNIYKLIRDFARIEKEKILMRINTCVRNENQNNVITPNTTVISEFPQSVEDVMRIAFDNCIMITQDVAEAYFLNRDSADWHNANGNKIRVAGIVSDIKQWVLRSQAMKAHNQRYYGDEPQRTGNYNGNERQQAGMNGNTRCRTYGATTSMLDPSQDSHPALDDGNYGDNDLSQSSKSMLD